jgi:acetylornithine deacetylase/succinyl-diaminopimelate desuccinylase-like protein
MSKLANRLLDLAAQIQQVPAPTFAEKKRARLLRGLFATERLKDVAVDGIHNVFARLPGRSRSQPLVVSAHLDTVFSDQSVSLRKEAGRIHGPGIGDNSLGVAALVGLVWMLRERASELSSDLWLVANTGEEGMGDLRGMKAVVDRFGADARAYLVLEGTALGQIFHRAIGVQRYRISVSTTGGHSWSDYGQPSAVHELASLVTQLTALRLPSSPRTTLNVGTIAGGTGINVLASHAQFELDVRSESEGALTSVVASIEERIRLARRDGVQVEMNVIGQRPAGEIPADHPLVRLAAQCLAAEGLTATLTSGSTDANVPLSRGLPSIVLGITTGGGTHTPQEYVDTAPVAQGMRQLVNFVEKSMGPQ